MTSTPNTSDRLVAFIRKFDTVAVAFSAGVDSTVVTQAAYLALGQKAIAFTSDSASLARQELDDAKALAQRIGIRHELLSTLEVSDARYAANGFDRCYHCKSHLYEAMHSVAEKFGVTTMLNGTNLDDLGDYRPGLQAADEFRVVSPLVECGIGKEQVRELAAYWDLPVWNKPAMPCLSSRIAYGTEVTPERLRMVESAEQCLRVSGWSECRVRYHAGDVARIEVPLDELGRFVEPTIREQIVEQFRSIGFRFVSLDLNGFRSGSLNSLITVDSMLPGKTSSDSPRAQSNEI